MDRTNIMVTKPKDQGSRARILDSIAVKLIDGASKLFENRSLESAERLGILVAKLVQRCDRKHRERTLSNLELAFPEWSATQRKEIANKMYCHFGRVVGDFLKAEQTTDEQILSHTEVIGLENLEEAESLNCGIIAITGHIGNWERMSQWMGATNRKLSVIARDANQGVLQDRVIRLRQSKGARVLSRGAAARGSLVALKRNEMVGILPDQNASEMFIPFFGMNSGWVRGPGVLHKSTGAPVLPAFCIWTSPGHYRLEILPMLTPNPEIDVVEGIMIEIAKALEHEIRQYPEQWLWMHDRWKSGRQQASGLQQLANEGLK